MILKWIFIIFLFLLIVYTIWYYQLKKKAVKKAKLASDAPKSDWSIDFLNSKRGLTDPLADSLVEHIINGNEEEHVNQLFSVFTGNHDKLPENAHPILINFFTETSKMPDWVDYDLLKFGQQIYIRHGLPIGMLLFYKSLPECYTGSKGAEVLIHSNRLNQKTGSMDSFARRLAETGKFIYETMMPGALSVDGKGIVAAQKVRLIHAVIRFYIKKHAWDESKFDQPINQEDMAGTLMSFSALVLEGLEQIGVDLSVAEREAYMHCWRVVGHIMGVHEELIPKNADDALALGHAIIDHQKAKSDAGVSLTEALLKFCDTKAPFFIKPAFHITMINNMIGSELAAMLGLPEVSEKKAKKLGKMVKRYIRFREALDHLIIFDFPIQMVDRLLLKFSVAYLSHNEILNFYMPKSLKVDLD
jgi:hypothetical protein